MRLDATGIEPVSGMEATARAKVLAGPLRQTLGELRALVEPPGAFDPKSTQRTFRISGGDDAGMTVLPPLIEGLRRDAPGIDIRFRYVEKDTVPGLSRPAAATD